MSDPVSPISRIGGQRRAGRRATDPAVAPEDEREETPAAGSNLPVPAGPLRSHDEGGAAAFEAQLLGQAGQKRGLRGGPPVLNQARSAYLGAEWSGRADRRPRKGRFTKTEI